MKKLTDIRLRSAFAAGFFYWTLILVFLTSKYPSIIGNNPEANGSGILQFMALVAAVAFSFSVWLWNFLKRESGKRDAGKIKIWHFLITLANSFYIFLQIEFINNPLLKDMETGYMALNVVFIFVLLMLLMLILNSWRRTMLAGNIFFLAMSLVFYFVYLFRGEPFQFIDIFSAGTAMEVAGGYDFQLTREIIIFGVTSFCSIGLYWQSEDYILVRKPKWKVLMRGLTAVFAAGLSFIYLNVGWNGALGILTDLYRPYKTYEEYGTTVGFLCVAKYMRLTPPEGYSEKAVKDTAKDVDTSSDDRGNKTKPVNIIAIMNESWADYRLLGDFNVTQPYMEFYDSMKENTIKGHTLVCIRGGGTAKTEYEFLTGNSVKRFPGMVPYVSYFTHDQYSLVTTLKSQGYRAEAMHPNKGSNWKRTSAYRMLQFDEFYTIDDFASSAKRIRQHISDQANYEKIIESVNQKENPKEPYFLFDVTMQNHGGYTDTAYKGDVNTVGYTNSSVNQYLSLLKESDDALKYLIEYFEDYDEPTMIVMFGDHYPDLPESFTEWITGEKFEESTLEEQEKYFATPFFIWANYDIPEEEGILTSTNYLSTLMLEQTNLKMTPYNYYLSGLMEKMPALNHLGYIDDKGGYIRWEDMDTDYKKLELQYEALQYNELAKDAGRLDNFFTIKNSP
ncbi:LTA synthase family protein [Novisyntrophococcus fermenticellae]|uniref:LTA synthase family protein n=1 Tax=Novisyntrophococcus fermenticellae TaxID=2068655 RepID=UPI001E3B6075|nr:LTA synthase family protein [Novisyntrophococcus fermenticellae]